MEKTVIFNPPIAFDKVAEPREPGDEELTNKELESLSLFTDLSKMPNFDDYGSATLLRRCDEGRVLCQQGEAGATAFYVLRREDVLAVRTLQAQAIDEILAAAASGIPVQTAEGAASAEQASSAGEGVPSTAAAAKAKKKEEPPHFVFSRKTPAELREIRREILEEIESLRRADPETKEAATAQIFTRLNADRSPPGFLRRMFARVRRRSVASDRPAPRFIPNDGPRDLDGQTLLAPIWDGDIFGEMSCMNRAPRSATVIVSRPCYVLEMLRNLLDRIRKDPVRKFLMDETYRINVLDLHLRNLTVFKNLTDDEMAEVRKQVRLIEVEPGTVLFEEHDQPDTCYVIRSGMIKVVKHVQCKLQKKEFKAAEWNNLWGVLGSPAERQKRLPTIFWNEFQKMRARLAARIKEIETVKTAIETAQKKAAAAKGADTGPPASGLGGIEMATFIQSLVHDLDELKSFDRDVADLHSALMAVSAWAEAETHQQTAAQSAAAAMQSATDALSAADVAAKSSTAADAPEGAAETAATLKAAAEAVAKSAGEAKAAAENAAKAALEAQTAATTAADALVRPANADTDGGRASEPTVDCAKLAAAGQLAATAARSAAAAAQTAAGAAQKGAEAVKPAPVVAALGPTGARPLPGKPPSPHGPAVAGAPPAAVSPLAAARAGAAAANPLAAARAAAAVPAGSPVAATPPVAKPPVGRPPVRGAAVVEAKLPEPKFPGNESIQDLLLAAFNRFIESGRVHLDATALGKTRDDVVAAVANPELSTQADRMPEDVGVWSEIQSRLFHRLFLEAAFAGGVPRRAATAKPRLTLRYRGRGEVVGEIGLLRNEARSATCVAFDHPEYDLKDKPGSKMGGVLSRVELVEIKKELFDWLAGKSIAFRKLMEDTANERREAPQAPANRPAERKVSDFSAVDEPEFDHYGLHQGQKLMLIDLDRCTRCGACVDACVSVHDDHRSRLYLDGPRFGNYLVPLTCRQCHDPVCMIGCPVGSIVRGDNGEIRIEDWCIGCRMCATQCPYGSIQIEPISPVSIDDLSPESRKRIPVQAELKFVEARAVVCDLCSSLPSRDPACCYSCPHDAAIRVNASEFFFAAGQAAGQS